MLLHCQIVVLNNAIVSHNEVRAFGCEPVGCVSVFSVTLMHAGHRYGHASFVYSTVPDPPPKHSAQTLLCSALCFMDYCQHFILEGSNKVLLSGE